MTSAIFCHDSFEPTLSSLWFAVCLTFWVFVDFHCHGLHVFRIQMSSQNKAWKGRESTLWNEATWYLLPWIVFDFFFPRRTVPEQAPSLFQIVFEVLLSLFLYDVFFYIGHAAIHRFQYLYVRIHKEHHTSEDIRATDSIRHTFVDGTFDVMCSVAALNVLRAHPLSRAIYNIIAITLITEAHSGMDFPWMLHNIIPCNLCMGPVRHNFHHRNHNKNFAKFFTFMDYVGGTLDICSAKNE